MYRIIDGRGTGKTSRLMLIAKETGATFICYNPYAMQEKAKAYGITGINFQPYKYLLDRSGRSHDEKIVIDELDAFLRCFSNDIIGYTISEDE